MKTNGLTFWYDCYFILDARTSFQSSERSLKILSPLRIGKTVTKPRRVQTCETCSGKDSGSRCAKEVQGKCGFGNPDGQVKYSFEFMAMIQESGLLLKCLQGPHKALKIFDICSFFTLSRCRGPHKSSVRAAYACLRPELV